MSVNLLFEETENKMKIKTYLASSSIETGLMRALVGDSRLAVGSGVAGRAAASVRPLSGVEAGGSTRRCSCTARVPCRTRVGSRDIERTDRKEVRSNRFHI
jgi:hypothetical protein